ncbi:MAG: RNA polymerase sigma factor, partial [Acidobacteriota bacterium]|nr:RNA polymerase sigma factor [Acidobacteriota bacterium]
LDDAAGGDPPASAPDPFAEAAGSELRGAIVECLQHLVEYRRRAVVLHLLGHSVPDIGRRLAWDAKRAENLVFRGMRDLRRCLENKGLAP